MNNRSIAGPPPFDSAPVGDEVVMQRRPNLKLVLMSATLQKDMGRMTDPNGIWRAPEKWIRSNAHLNAPTVFRKGGFWAMFSVKGGENWFNITQLESEEKQPFSSMTLTAIRGNGDGGSE